MTNIAEGSGRGSDADFLRFLNIAYGSMLEVESLLFAAIDLNYLPELQSKVAFNLTAEVGKMLNAFKSKLKE